MSLFQKSLHDLIRGIRSNPSCEDRYIRLCLDEIRAEVKRTDLDVKAVAIAKLFYLHMFGYDMEWAAFHVIEVMSSHNLAHKRIGYIAAAISFRQDTNVLMLCTNLIRKDLNSNNFLETALAINGLCTIVTPDLGRDLSPDLIANMNHSRPYIRKRVILCLYKVFLKYPEALRVAVPRLKERLEDPDASVVSAAVNVVCELARKNPKSYLPLAPQLFSILTTSTNNWLLIKIVKLFGALCPLEPRLIKRMMAPITNIIQTTGAVSLAYECILTAITGGMILPESNVEIDGASATLKESSDRNSPESVLASLCVAKLKTFISDTDQNLKYLGLFALCKLLPFRPHAIGEHREIILSCLEDKDISIRMRALELIAAMVTKRNLVAIVNHLMRQLVPAQNGESSEAANSSALSVTDTSYAIEVVSRILQFCSNRTYALVTDFEWYIRVLVGFAGIRGVGGAPGVAEAVCEQIIDVCVRVEGVREIAVEILGDLILDEQFLEAAVSTQDNTAQVLFAAAWVVGEYSMFLETPKAVICHLVSPKLVALPATVQAAYIQATMKIYSMWVSGGTKNQTANAGDNTEGAATPLPITKHEFEELTTVMLQGFERMTGSNDLEVQERASTSFQILNLIFSLTQDEPSTDEWTVPSYAFDLGDLFKADLNPVDPQAQGLVPVPDGLDLDCWIHDPEPDILAAEKALNDDDDDDDENGFFSKRKKGLLKREDIAKTKKAIEEKRQADAAFYISATDKVDTAPAGASPKSTNSPSFKSIMAQSKPKRSPFEADIFAAPATLRTQYAINRNDELPSGVSRPQSPAATPKAKATQESKALAEKGKARKIGMAADEAENNAIRSVDLSADSITLPRSDGTKTSPASKLGWEVDRAVLLTEETPRLDGVGVAVVRKVKKPVAAGESGSATSGKVIRKVIKKKDATNQNVNDVAADVVDKPAAGEKAVRKVIRKVVKKKAPGVSEATPDSENGDTKGQLIAISPEEVEKVVSVSMPDAATAAVATDRASSSPLVNEIVIVPVSPTAGPDIGMSDLSTAWREPETNDGKNHLLKVIYASMDPQLITASPTFSVCNESEDVVLGFDCTSKESSTGKIEISIVLVLLNQSESTDVRQLTCSVTSEGVSLLVQQDSVGPGSFGKVLMQFEVDIASHDSGVQSRTIEGACIAEFGGQPRTYLFTIPIPVTIHLIPNFAITPDEFVTVLANASNFPHTSLIQFPIVDIRAFDQVVKDLAGRLRLGIVEAVPQAVSVYGRGYHGVHVAGLVKVREKDAKSSAMLKGKGKGGGGAAGAGVRGGWVSVELKSGDSALLEWLIAEANDFPVTL
ncbi:AP-3 complex subunit delta-1 [Entophlyctis sp. JEL0112]|nr:AP-3 complex subunit delta-1 [Entophlyctis sp. JEL0112]